MTVSYWCVALAALLPYVFVVIAKSSRAYLFEGHNRAPRAYGEGLEGARKRAYWAQLNGFEAFPPFAAAVIIAVLSGADGARVDLLAVLFILCRVAHGLLYIADKAILRSVAWFGGIGCVAALFLLAALA